MGKRKKYIPKAGTKEHRLIRLTKEIDIQKKQIEQNKLLSDQKYRALQDFVRLLTNFASHDIKNAIHNMDGRISTMSDENLLLEDINALKSCLDNIRSSLQEFKVLSSDVEKGEFRLVEIESAIKSLHRPLFKKGKILFNVEYDNVSKNQVAYLTFHPILQVINNMIINSYEFLDGSEKREINMTFSLESQENDFIIIAIKDTGIGIPEENKEKIFLPYFTTKEGGSGVGLAHVEYTLNNIGGSIELIEDDSYFSTVFKLRLPTK